MNNFSKIMEWSTWANLDAQKNIELILLKGHLILESLIDVALAKNSLEKELDYSFFRKVNCLKLLPSQNFAKIDELSSYLHALNKMRNKLAHEYSYNINNGEIEKWSLEVLNSFEGMKFTKFTCRTKIVHAFSALAKALAKIE